MAWADALLASRILAANPLAIGGIRLRARAGPVRDRWLKILHEEAGQRFPFRKLPSNIAQDRLLGGLDLAATMAVGKPVMQPGLLTEVSGGIVIVPMAERLAPHIAAALIPALDQGDVALVLLDEGEDGDEAPPAAIVERMGLSCWLDGVSLRDLEAVPEASAAGDTMADAAEALCRIAGAFGIASSRAPILALAAARAIAAGAEPAATDIEAAARLCLLPRATMIPSAANLEDAEAPSEGTTEPEDAGRLADRIIEATAASLPPNILASLERTGAGGRSKQAGRGAAGLRKSLTRGRPIGARPGKPGGGARLHLIETLRAAAPWQKLRPGDGVQVRAQDFRIRRYAQKSESTLIFVVDASGSAAAERMAEAKGAVELLLAEAYVKRTQVALAGFRGEGAEFLLPPTRSLVRAKRELAEMAGGGGTPLAAGIEAGQILAEAERGRGRTPFVVLMTDGRANVARDGHTGRSAADDDARLAAKRLAASGIKSVVIDIAARPRADARQLAAAMCADYAALPRADARATQAIVSALTP